MLEKRGADWAGKVRIIGLSIDNAAEAVVKHVEAKGWKAIEHYHRAGSDCSQVYGVNGVPHVMLIDTQGTIAFKGHPANRPDLEKDFDALLRGEKLTGKGTADEGAGEEKEGEGEAKKGEGEHDLAQINAEIDAFKQLAENDFQKNEELKTLAKDMPRAFCVMVLESKFNAQTGKWGGSFTNYRVCVIPRHSR